MHKTTLQSYANSNAFGMLQPKRNYTLSEEYKFGYNTQEHTDEIKGSGNHYTAKFWEYDPRVVTRWNKDPITSPWQTPYTINNNNPIQYTDPDGDVGVIGAVGGAIVGAVVEVAGQMIANYRDDKPLTEKIDWADVIITAGEGAVIGATGGISLLFTEGTASVLRAEFDWTKEDGFVTGGGLFGGEIKDPDKLKSDLICEAISIGLGRIIPTDWASKEMARLGGRRFIKGVIKKTVETAVGLAKQQTVKEGFERLNVEKDGGLYVKVRNPNDLDEEGFIKDDATVDAVKPLETVEIKADKTDNKKND
jgi:hypothetical protein